MPIYLLSPSTILVVEVIIKLNNMIDKKTEEAKEEIYEDRFLLNGEEVVFDNDDKEEMFCKEDIKEAIWLGAKCNVWKYGLGFALQIENRNKPVDISRCFTFRPRSSVWKTGMVLSNCEGTVDDSYTGEISAVFYHVMPNMPRYKVGDKIVQFHLETSDNIMLIETDELNKTERGDNGYGSSDKK